MRWRESTNSGAWGRRRSSFSPLQCNWKIAFAYVMNQMEQSLLPTEKASRLVDTIYGRGD
ncbi:MAG: hypothetical protein DMF09_14470 [Verrucomicrobia bacterium]|nr:MAG: hypothetical protein DMF09_14470 [Verrucomicrobiota bacterium]